MEQNDGAGSDDIVTERDLLIASFIVAIGLMTFCIAYWGGRDLGSTLFS